MVPFFKYKGIVDTAREWQEQSPIMESIYISNFHQNLFTKWSDLDDRINLKIPWNSKNIPRKISKFPEQSQRHLVRRDTMYMDGWTEGTIPGDDSLLNAN